MTDWQTGKLKIWLRALAFTVAVLFTWNTVVYADGSGNLLQLLTSRSEAAPLPEKSPLSIPQEIGRIQKSFWVPASPLVIHIQDVHANEEAQRRVGEIIEFLAKERGVRLVNIEGSSGELAHHLLSAYPHEKARTLVADHFLGEGMITGPEHLALSKRPDLILNGVEDPAVYENNRTVFLEALQFKDRHLETLKELRTIMETLGRHVFSEKLWNLMLRRKAFLDEEGNLGDYLDELVHNSEGIFDRVTYPQIDALLKAQALEREMTDQETDGAAKGLMEKLQSTINVDIFDEIQDLEEKVKSLLMKSETERKLNHLFRILEIYEKIFALSLTHDDARFYYEHRREFNERTFLELTSLLDSNRVDLKLTGLDLPGLDRDLVRIERFYELALKRDQILVKQTLLAMQEHGQSASVLVTGGFHTPGIERLFEKNQVSFIVVSPTIKKDLNLKKESERYAEAMRSEPGRFASQLVKEYFQSRPVRVNDPRYQLGAPSRLPERAELGNIDLRPDGQFDPRDVVATHPELGLLMTGAPLETAVAASLDGSMPSPERIRQALESQLWPEERRLEPLHHLVLNGAELYQRGEAHGLLLGGRTFGKDGAFVALAWQPVRERGEITVRRDGGESFHIGPMQYRLWIGRDRSLLAARFQAEREGKRAEDLRPTDVLKLHREQAARRRAEARKRTLTERFEASEQEISQADQELQKLLERYLSGLKTRMVRAHEALGRQIEALNALEESEIKAEVNNLRKQFIREFQGLKSLPFYVEKQSEVAGILKTESKKLEGLLSLKRHQLAMHAKLTAQREAVNVMTRDTVIPREKLETTVQQILEEFDRDAATLSFSEGWKPEEVVSLRQRIRHPLETEAKDILQVDHRRRQIFEAERQVTLWHGALNQIASIPTEKLTPEEVATARDRAGQTDKLTRGILDELSEDIVILIQDKDGIPQLLDRIETKQAIAVRIRTLDVVLDRDIKSAFAVLKLKTAKDVTSSFARSIRKIRKQMLREARSIRRMKGFDKEKGHKMLGPVVNRSRKMLRAGEKVYQKRVHERKSRDVRLREFLEKIKQAEAEIADRVNALKGGVNAAGLAELAALTETKLQTLRHEAASLSSVPQAAVALNRAVARIHRMIQRMDGRSPWLTWGRWLKVAGVTTGLAAIVGLAGIVWHFVTEAAETVPVGTALGGTLGYWIAGFAAVYGLVIFLLNRPGRVSVTDEALIQGLKQKQTRQILEESLRALGSRIENELALKRQAIENMKLDEPYHQDEEAFKADADTLKESINREMERIRTMDGYVARTDGSRLDRLIARLDTGLVGLKKLHRQTLNWILSIEKKEKELKKYLAQLSQLESLSKENPKPSHVSQAEEILASVQEVKESLVAEMEATVREGVRLAPDKVKDVRERYLGVFKARLTGIESTLSKEVDDIRIGTASARPLNLKSRIKELQTGLKEELIQIEEVPSLAEEVDSIYEPYRQAIKQIWARYEEKALVAVPRKPTAPPVAKRPKPAAPPSAPPVPTEEKKKAAPAPTAPVEKKKVAPAKIDAEAAARQLALEVAARQQLLDQQAAQEALIKQQAEATRKQVAKQIDAKWKVVFDHVVAVSQRLTETEQNGQIYDARQDLIEWFNLPPGTGEPLVKALDQFERDREVLLKTLEGKPGQDVNEIEKIRLRFLESERDLLENDADKGGVNVELLTQQITFGKLPQLDREIVATEKKVRGEVRATEPDELERRLQEIEERVQRRKQRHSEGILKRYERSLRNTPTVISELKQLPKQGWFKEYVLSLKPENNDELKHLATLGDNDYYDQAKGRLVTAFKKFQDEDLDALGTLYEEKVGALLEPPQTLFPSPQPPSAIGLEAALGPTEAPEPKGPAPTQREAGPAPLTGLAGEAATTQINGENEGR